MSEKVTVSIELDTLEVVIRQMKRALEPMVRYRIDPLEFCRAAHAVKDEHIRSALAMLPPEIVASVDKGE